MLKIIPRREPELVQAEANRFWRGDTEKVATTSIADFDFEGTLISSRYQKADEYQLMLDTLVTIGPRDRHQIKRMFCDSKAGDSYSIEMNHSQAVQARRIVGGIESQIRARRGGHNGIFVEGPDGASLFAIDPDWIDDIVP